VTALATAITQSQSEVKQLKDMYDMLRHQKETEAAEAAQAAAEERVRYEGQLEHLHQELEAVKGKPRGWGGVGGVG
jgi:phage host-nuclease inhibitor protein Gam